MKQAVTGYITALINTYSKKLNVRSNPIAEQTNRNIIRDLNDLLDFVIDAPGETVNLKPITVILKGGNLNE